MVDVLLAHSFFLSNDPKQMEKMRPYPPLGPSYAASQLRQCGYRVALFDAMLSDGVHEFEDMLDRQRPSVVALYEDSFNFLNKMCLLHSRRGGVPDEPASRERAGLPWWPRALTSQTIPRSYFAHGVQYALVGRGGSHGCSRLSGRCSDGPRRPSRRFPGLPTPLV